MPITSTPSTTTESTQQQCACTFSVEELLAEVTCELAEADFIRKEEWKGFSPPDVESGLDVLARTLGALAKTLLAIALQQEAKGK